MGRVRCVHMDDDSRPATVLSPRTAGGAGLEAARRGLRRRSCSSSASRGRRSYRRVRKGRLHRLPPRRVRGGSRCRCSLAAGQLAAVLACGSGRRCSAIDSAAPSGGWCAVHRGSRSPRPGARGSRARLGGSPVAADSPDDRAVSQAACPSPASRGRSWTSPTSLSRAAPRRRGPPGRGPAALRPGSDRAHARTAARAVPGAAPRARSGGLCPATPRSLRKRGERASCASVATTACPLPQANLWIRAATSSTSTGPTPRLGVELDGEPWHRTTRAFHEDRSGPGARDLRDPGQPCDTAGSEAPGGARSRAEAIRARRLAMLR